MFKAFAINFKFDNEVFTTPLSIREITETSQSQSIDN